MATSGLGPASATVISNGRLQADPFATVSESASPLCHAITSGHVAASRRRATQVSRPCRSIRCTSAEGGVIDLVRRQTQESTRHLLLELLGPNGLGWRRSFSAGEF